jgi:hypothetical protein
VEPLKAQPELLKNDVAGKHAALLQQYQMHDPLLAVFTFFSDFRWLFPLPKDYPKSNKPSSV